MATKAHDICDEVLKTLKLSNICFLIKETPFAIEIKLKKKFSSDLSEPQPAFYEPKLSRNQCSYQCEHESDDPKKQQQQAGQQVLIPPHHSE